VEIVELLRDPAYIAAGRRMAERSRGDDAHPDDGQVAMHAVGERAGAAVRAGVDPNSAAALEVIEQVEATMPQGGGNRAELAERIETFTDRRVFRYWTLVGIVNGWTQPAVTADDGRAWEWYAQALRAHS
jgi:hypothetical protein